MLIIRHMINLLCVSCYYYYDDYDLLIIYFNTAAILRINQVQATGLGGATLPEMRSW